MPQDRPKSGRHIPQTRPLDTAPAQPQVVYLHQLHEKSGDFRHLLMHILLPVDLLSEFDIDPITLRNAAGEVMVEVAQAQAGHVWGVRVLNDIDRRDPLLEIELTDTVFGRISVTWVGMNDPRAPRFDIDLTPEGEPTLRGTARRHVQAEAAALLAGLAPGQVRAGLGMFHRLLWDLDQLMAALHHREYEVEPLYYHNAILFERAGFVYAQGRDRMKHLHEAFAAGGDLARRLDGSTPFRDPILAESVRGRSWALHDGLWEEPWDGIKLVKRIGAQARDLTAGDLLW